MSVLKRRFNGKVTLIARRVIRENICGVAGRQSTTFLNEEFFNSIRKQC